MPRATAPRFNVQFLEWLQELKSDLEPDSNLYRTYTKAINGLKEIKKEFATPRELTEVKGIGPGIVKTLEKRYALENGGPSSQSPPAPARGRPVKRSATEVDVEPPPQAKRRTASTSVLPTQITTSHPASTPAGDEAFKFWYLDVDGKRVRNRMEAETSWVEDGTQLLRMKVIYPSSQDNHPLAAQLLGRQRRGNTMVAEMREDTADRFPQCPGFTEASAPAPAKRPSLLALLDEEKLAQKRSGNSNDPSRQLSDMRSAAAARSYASLSQVTRASSPPASQLTSSPSTSISPSPPLFPARPLCRAATTAVASSSISAALHRTTSAPNPPPARPRLSHAVPGLPPVEHPSLYMPHATFPPFETRVFRAGEYTVRLVLDNRETGGAGNRDKIGAGLRVNGVDVETRALALGDVAWIAKRGAEECMLDVVLERKRLDDLVGSIKDGRFHEQKFRLMQSGISSVLYLVEAYDTRRQKADWGVQISTALSSTQVVDGFMVKETKNIDDTISYLTGLTDELKRVHQTKDLHIIPTQMIRRHSYVDLQKYLRREKADRCFVTSWADFQDLNHKSRFTTVRDTWTRMLLCVKGMSAEKVGAVVERWDTPRALWEAFRAAEMEEQDARAREEAEAAGPAKGKGKKKKSAQPEAKMMLQGVGGAEGGVRAIGPALSAKIYELLTAAAYDE
ncbi:ERCC4 domain-containing protein [Mycena maculata]|uniref:Crossover junction endonuclease MUS81 n=1 Tax=Mycena maculata TaxID=230809 RepID=A0AAD7I501_9AGAR|nr:ERCC4 domain-containing protein [Mycena maculata]